MKAGGDKEEVDNQVLDDSIPKIPFFTTHILRQSQKIYLNKGDGNFVNMRFL